MLCPCTFSWHNDRVQPSNLSFIYHEASLWLAIYSLNKWLLFESSFPEDSFGCQWVTNTNVSVPLWSISRPKAMLCWTVQFCSIAGLWHLYLLSCFLSCICVFSFGRKLNLETIESAETRQQIVLIRNYHKLCKQCFSHREIQQYGANKSINLFMNWLKEEEKNIAFLFTDSNKPFPAGYRFYKKYLHIYR